MNRRGTLAVPRRGGLFHAAIGQLLMLLLIVGVGCSQEVPLPARSPDPLPQARQALAEEDYAAALALADSVPRSSADWGAARLVAGEAAMKAGDLEQSLEQYLLLADESNQPHQAAEGHFYAAEVYRELGWLDDAVQAYQEVLKSLPDNAATHERLALLLSACGRNWEAQPHYWFLVRSGSASLEELALFADLDRPSDQRPFLESCLQKRPDDPLAQLGLAAHDYWDGNRDEALGRLAPLLKEHPRLIAGQAIVGEALVAGPATEFLAWHARLPADADRYPEIWYVRGLWARRQGQLQIAARCFWEAARLAPTHRRAIYQLGQVLTSLEAPGAVEFRQRADELIQLTQVIDAVLRSEGQHEAPIRQTAALLEQMGRIWEACGWALLVREQFSGSNWPAELFARWTPLLNDDLPVTRPDSNLALRYDLSDYPSFHVLTEEPASAQPEPEPSAASTRAGANIAFAAQPLDFVYFNGADPQTRGARQFEQTGGGVAVLDLDRDGAADLFLTQGCEWPTGAQTPASSGRYRDRLFRNRSGTPADISAQALPADPGFGQGCTAGDFDNDGFCDLYIANVGRNQLLRNLGDGTFVDVTPTANLDRGDWTTSVVMADLNLDGLPDLFDVNYLQGPGVYTRICEDVACSPSVFSGVLDQLWINQGDGLFENAPVDERVEDAKGLGVVALPIGDGARLSLFVANDQVANFLLRNEPNANPDGIQLVEQAFVTGLAYNDDGLAMACMGIAADDVDNDGLTDLFVTNFADEPNTLYKQDSSGLFVDASNLTNLESASYTYVGWGTQFLDADLDGRTDLVLTNGHVDDYTPRGGAYHMRPQFFVNRGSALFDELFADSLGEYFSGAYVGRGLARLDWNRDGLMDFVVSNIGDRSVLVTNRTRSAGHFLNFRLHAVRTARDAIGTQVTVSAGGKSWTRSLLAGDGYQASNERLLQFGLGDIDDDIEVLIRWPSGALTRIRNPVVDRTCEVVEGATAATQWDNGWPTALRVDPEAPVGEPSQ